MNQQFEKDFIDDMDNDLFQEDESFCNFQDDEEFYPKQKYVAGYLENQIELQQGCDRQDYTNWQVNQYLDAYFRFFGKKDMDIVYLYFISRKKQEQIMQILGKTQPAVSYDVTKIKEQINFVIKLIASLDDFIMFIVDPDNKMKTMDKQMLVLFFYTTSIAKTARLMGINNITCRSHLYTIVNRLLSQGHIDMYNLFKYIMGNLNSVKKHVDNQEDSEQ